MEIKKPRGTKDILPDTASLYHLLDILARRIFEIYGYREIIIPVFENVELFKRSIGEQTDIVEKEMFVFNDRKGRMMALRPEGTAGVVRAYIENRISSILPVAKYYYYGPMFRYEKPQAGRYREFYQIGAEYIGDSTPCADFEIIEISTEIIRSFGIDSKLYVHVNTVGCQKCRPLYKKFLVENLNERVEKLCDDCKKRFQKNPLRILDCKIDRYNLKDIPAIDKYLCDDCKAHFEKFMNIIDSIEKQYSIIRDSTLVRGLDYYTNVVFEVKTEGLSEFENTIAAGGRYDTLIKQLGGPEIPACGFAIGVERLISIKRNILGNKYDEYRTVLIAVTGENVIDKSVFLKRKLIEEIKKRNLFISIVGPFYNRSLKSQMRLAENLNALYVIIVGEDELRKDSIILRNMKEKLQQEVKIDNMSLLLDNII